MRPRIRCVPLLLAALVALAPAPAAAQVAGAYVLYFQAMGGWGVMCWRDELTGTIACSADAPPPALGNAPAIVVHVTEVASGAFAVTMDVRASVPPGATVSVSVDGGNPLDVPLDREYQGRIEGPQAGRLVADMLAGQHLIIDAPPYGSGEAVEVVIGLADFARAFETMRVNLRTYGAVRDP